MSTKEDHVCTLEQQIKYPQNKYRHLFILGAGASKAACLDIPEKNGKSIPLMDDLPEHINLAPYLEDIPDDRKQQNFEKLFSELFNKEAPSERIFQIEREIGDYFSSLLLPDTPTIYDYLVLSLRDKDMIATFNWDPFLVQAYMRNHKFCQNLPQLIFLHGNVAVGYDKNTGRFGQIIKKDESLKDFQPTKLLYPVENKDYNSDPFIKSQWDILLDYLDKSTLVSIYGYSAPVTDVEAKSLMKKVWGEPETDRYMEEVEIINIASIEEVDKTWRDFICSHHFTHITSIFDERSWIYSFPRRTGEMYYMRYIEGKFQEENHPPRFKSLDEMWEWYSKLIYYDSKSK